MLALATLPAHRTTQRAPSKPAPYPAIRAAVPTPATCSRSAVSQVVRRRVRNTEDVVRRAFQQHAESHEVVPWDLVCPCDVLREPRRVDPQHVSDVVLADCAAPATGPCHSELLLEAALQLRYRPRLPILLDARH